MKGYLCLSEYVTKRGVGAHGVVCVSINVCERQGVFDWDVFVTQNIAKVGSV